MDATTLPAADDTLRERLRVLLFARVLAVTVFLAGAGAYQLTVSHGERVVGPETFVVVIAAYVLTVASALAVRRVSWLRAFAYLQTVFDVLLLTGAIVFARGVGSPMAVLYVLAIANAAGLLLMRGALVSALASSIAYVFLVVQQSALVGARDGVLLDVVTPALLGTSCLTIAAVLIGSLARRLAAAESQLSLRDHEVSRLEGLQRALANGLESGLLVADQSGRVRSANPASQDILGLPISSILGREVSWLIPMLVTSEDEDPGSELRECEYRAPDGESSRLRIKRTPLFDTFGNRAGEIVLLQDVTRIQELEARLAQDENAALLIGGEVAGEAPPADGAEPGDDQRDGIVSTCAAMRAVSKLIDKVAHADATVLVTGESGTGKELVARAIHRRSARANAPFVVVNCGAIPENLIESELFGHVRGAFTGAVGDRPGLFRRAHGGTIFLDEIGELPLQLQVRLLRVLQDRMVMPVGGNTPVAVDVRVVAATNRVLEDLVKAGQFREDLYYRLAVIAIHLPPLREREGDLERLIEHFVRTAAVRHAKQVTRVAGRAMHLLLRHRYPGNVRELENVIEHATTLADGDAIREQDLPESVRDAEGVRAVPIASTRDRRFDGVEESDVGLGDAVGEEDVPSYVESGMLRELGAAVVLPIDEGAGASLDDQLARQEKEALLAALARAAGVKKKAATLLGINYRSFRHRLQKYGLDGHGDDVPPRLSPAPFLRESGH
ncbi:sigma 54-interacting transcriptional regulator [Candidatus Binatia bacterium]|nr:sigma 54-interacting transcriptional regulator [Candidatus Binatia bacterium]